MQAIDGLRGAGDLAWDLNKVRHLGNARAFHRSLTFSLSFARLDTN